MEQHLHSIHCHLYLRTETIMFAVNCKQVGCPTTRTYRIKGCGRMDQGDLTGQQKGARTFILCRRTVNSKLSFRIIDIWFLLKDQFEPRKFCFTNNFLQIEQQWTRSLILFTSAIFFKLKINFILSVFHLSSALNVRNNETLFMFFFPHKVFLFDDTCNFWCCVFEHTVYLFGVIDGK